MYLDCIFNLREVGIMTAILNYRLFLLHLLTLCSHQSSKIVNAGTVYNIDVHC